MTNYDISWYIMIYHDISWHIMTFCHTNKKHHFIAKARNYWDYWEDDVVAWPVTSVHHQPALLVSSPSSLDSRPALPYSARYKPHTQSLQRQREFKQRGLITLHSTRYKQHTQSFLLYTEKETKASYWGSSMSPKPSTQKGKQKDHITKVQCLTYFSPKLSTQKGKQRDHIAEGTASFDLPPTSLVALQSEILSLMSWSRTRDKAFFFSSTLRGYGTCDIQTRKYLSE